MFCRVSRKIQANSILDLDIIIVTMIHYYYCYHYGSCTHLDARFKKKKTTARRITVASFVYKFTKDMLFKILYMNLLKIL